MDTMSEAIAAYDDFLDEAYSPDGMGGGIEVAGIGFAPSRILRELDPIAYRVGFFDWADAEGIDTDELEDDEVLP